MKYLHVYLLTFCLFACMAIPSVFAQAPQGINYQAVARDANGALIQQTGITVVFRIRSGTASGAIVYEETHNPTTNDYGLFNLVIGQGTVNTGVFADIDWHNETHFLEVSIDGTSMGSTQLVSVPYALAVAPRKQYYSIPGAVFQPNDNTATFRTSIGQGGAEITQKATGITSVLDAQVNLPHGAVITHFTIFFKDESTAQDLNITLNRESLSAGFFDPIIDITTSGNTAGWRSSNVSVPNVVVDNQTYGHFIRVFCSNWDAAGTKAIKGVLIEYSY